MTCVDIKSHKERGFTLSLEGTVFEKPHGGGVKLRPSPPRFRVKKFHNIHRKTPLLESLFKKGAGLQAIFP